jgi:hypothetical protein
MRFPVRSQENSGEVKEIAGNATECPYAIESWQRISIREPQMQIPVLVEPVANEGFRATAGAPLPVSAEGATPDDALRNLRAVMDRHLKDGKQLASVEFPDTENPWLAMAGIFDQNDPLVQEWKAAMAEYRLEVELDPDRP